ncbi:hypothetical protein [Halorubrum sp. SD626R]|uniref:hypothetical protein n=1 Tax=Halorubrum sp. SD626R TaxID=1419722 RepID=UPI0023B95F34|nr:hypothetical protein [Halorubrum sp. SD626R]
MNRSIALVAAAVVLVGVAGIAAAGPVGTAVAQDDPVATNETDAGNETANESDISPGERLSGVIGVQRAEIAGEVDSRAFEVGLNRTETAEERADLVADRLNRTEERLDEIERRQRELRERRDAGELSQGAFAARMAELGARAETVEREANRSVDVARELPESARADRGLNETRLDRLRERASEAGGPEVAAIARGVAGNGVGGPLAADRRGPPENPGRGGGPGQSGGPGRGDGAGDAGNGSEVDGNGTSEEMAPGAGAGAEDGEGPPAADRPGRGDGPDADGNATDREGSTDGAANGTDADGDRGNGAGGEGATPPGDDPSSPADDDRGDGSDAGDGGAGPDGTDSSPGDGSDAGDSNPSPGDGSDADGSPSGSSGADG